MPERRTHRTNRGAVGQIALPSRDRKLFRKMVEQRVRDSEIALAVFEIDWINFMRHHRRSGLARNRLLREVADRDVVPHVAAESEQDRVDTRHDREQLGDKVVAFDLGGQRIPGQPESLHEILAVRDPIDLRMREMMRVEVANRAVELAEKFLALELRE